MSVFTRVATARLGMLELLAAAVLLGLGVNVLATLLLARVGDEVATGIAVVLVLIAIVGLAAVRLRSLTEETRFEAFLPIVDDEVVEVPGYGFASDVSRALKAARTEKPALDRQWRDEPLVAPRSNREAGVDHRNLDGGAARLLREAAEYAFLERLSTHLGGYFQRNARLAGRTEELVRDDLLPLLPENRVLDLLSSPVEDRIALRPGKDEDSDETQPLIEIKRISQTSSGRTETLVSALRGEYMFQRLDLELPRGSVVKRLGAGHVLIEGALLRTERSSIPRRELRPRS